MVRILYVAQTYHPKIGGAERYIDRLAEAMSNRGHDVYVMAPPYEGEELHRTYGVIRTDFYDKWKRGVFYYLRAWPMSSTIMRLIKEKSINVVHFQYINPFAVAARRFKRAGTSVFATVHGSGFIFMRDDWLGSRLLRRTLRTLDGVFPVSDYCGDLCISHGAPAEKVHVTYNGTDPDIFQPRPDEVDHSMIFTASRLVPRKDIPTLLKALASLKEDIPDAHLVVAGDGPERENLEKLTRSLGLEGNVNFLGFVDDETLRDLYARCGVFVLPAVYDERGKDIEGFGIVLLEAMASGRPVIGARVGGIPSAVNEKWGHLYEPGNAEDLREKLYAVLSDVKKADAMGREGRRAVENIYNWPDIAAKMEEVYVGE